MIFTILGSGTFVPDATRGAPGYLLRRDGRSVLVDGGTGTLHRLARLGVAPLSLDGGVYSHRHVDHTGDLVPLLFGLAVDLEVPRTAALPIWAGAGFAAFIEALRGVYGRWISPARVEVPIHELSLEGPDGADLPGGIRLDTRPARHPEGALHLRFTDPGGGTVVFSGDTGPSEDLAILARDADLLVCECAAREGEEVPFHLSAPEVADLVATARPRRVVLTHLYPWADVEACRERVARTGVPVEIATDGTSWEV